MVAGIALRPARSVDVFRLVELMAQVHAQSRYAGSIDIDEKHARVLLAQAIQRHGGQTPGSALVNVVVNRKEVIQSFAVGVLDRVYHVGTALCAQDMFLISAPDAPRGAARALIDAYVDWAERNPRVAEIHLSHTDIVPGSALMGRHYERLGFTRCGAIYRREIAAREEAQAA